MKTKRNTRSRAKDFLVILFCLSGAAASLWLFWKDFTAVLEKLNDTPIATVSWKYKAAQRKFSDRLIWDRLQQESFIYNGDTIRTSEGAETTVTFKDSQLQLGENTIIQIQVYDDGMTSVNLSGGILSATADRGSNLKLTSGSVTISLEEGSALTASADGSEPLSLQVTSGNATILDATGSHSIGEGEGMAYNTDGMVVTKAITILEPAPQVRVLKFEGDTSPVDFKWSTGSLPPDSQLVFETSPDRQFTQIAEYVELAGLSSITMDLAAGTHYWRLYARVNGVPVEGSMEEGRISVLDAPTPVPIVPANGDSFSFRTRMPSVRFMWEGNEYASSYLFEVADNPQMSNPTISQNTAYPSSIVSTLGRGTWYWRITPYYSLGSIGYGLPSRPTSFFIDQQGQLNSPTPLTPINGQIVNIVSHEQEEGTIFSWKKEIEAEKYIVRLSQNENMSTIVSTTTTQNNYVTIDGLTTGRWYWSVSQVDAEGNESGNKGAQSFLAVDKEIVFQQIFPPEGYQIANTRIPDIRFTWKNNIEDEIHLQVSNSQDFGEIVYETAYTSDAVGGFMPRLEVGTYWWRLASGGLDTGLTTKPRSFTVIPQLPKASIISPLGGATAISRPGMSVKLEWAPVKGANYYQVLIYSSTSTEPIAQELFSEDTESEVLFDNFPDGVYRWTVQAFCDETISSTRVTGLLSESFFALKKIYPVTLRTPSDGNVFDGVQAYLRPGSVGFDSRSAVVNYELVLVKGAYGSQLPHQYKGATSIPNDAVVFRGESRQLPALTAGTYWWTINATTQGNYDISNLTPRSFRVLPIPPLPPSAALEPAAGTVYDENYLVNSLTTQLKWAPVADAEAYHLTIVNEQTKQVVQEMILPATEGDSMVHELDLAAIGLGKFSWTVRGRQYVPTTGPRNLQADTILRAGEPAVSHFTVSLPEEEIVVEGPGDLYGN